MSLTGLLEFSQQLPGLKQLKSNGFSDSQIINAIKSLQPFVIASAAEKSQTIVAVTATSRECEDLAAALKSLAPQLSVEVFPSWETLPHEKLSPSREVVGKRLALIHRIKTGEQIDVICAPLRSLLQPFAADLGGIAPLTLQVDAEIEISDLARQLVLLGYERVDLVERRGQLAVRGGIVDVFSPLDDHPVRIEFWDSTIEQLRKFNVADQRSINAPVTQVVIPACREILLTEAVKARAAELAEQHPLFTESLSAIAAGQLIEGVESLAPLLVGELTTLVQLLPNKSTVVLLEPERIRARAEDLIETSAEFLQAAWSVAASGGDSPLNLDASSFKSLGEIHALAVQNQINWVTISALTADAELTNSKVLAIPAKFVNGYKSDLDLLTRDLTAAMAAGTAIAIVAAGAGSAQRYAEAITERQLPLTNALANNKTWVTSGFLPAGFIADQLIVITESEITGQQSAIRDQVKLPSRRKRQIDPLSLVPGDFIVHEQHGIGQFVELIERTVQGATREYLVVEYAASKRGHPGDRLYLPTDQLDQVSKYVGGETPALSKMGGADWNKAKSRARKAVKEIAGELIRLYAARQAAPGFQFSPDTQWQRELEDAFPYQETPDQLATIEEVKADMERAVPMDRVVCGDVGFGKTEIALRAAFKATQDGKQVAVLAPTTLLVQQHLQTFTQRFAPFPITVAALSRFQTDKEAKKVLAELASGKIDVVIGTHRLLGSEVVFKDLGLVVIDEEQRFGVEHKEHLKALRAHVDVLAMSATPIPRTLEMSITGIRDMSVMQTPPEERLPVLTYVGAFDLGQIGAAIKRELIRDGQVFYVHNRVESIDRVAQQIQELVPQARIAVAHGQMSETALEQTVIKFWEREIDVLVCTTIVESGLDIPNANTLIVDRAEMLGLSQLHQLRGRVGRSRERGYAYFFHSADRTLTDVAHERLVTIAQQNSLGAGMAVALKDLEIRGAGNLLGGEQSGHIADVGFDLYIRMVGEALNDYRGLPTETNTEVRLELPINAHIPHDWISEERLRLEAYRRISQAGDAAALADVEAELSDRYGQLPAVVTALFDVARLRIYAKQVGLTEIILQGKNVRFAPVTLADSMRVRLTRLYPGSIIKPATRSILVPLNKEDLDLLSWTRKVIETAIESPITTRRSNESA
ncbi:MAG: transcription-repair coupling factor [Candidatus Nanopelagicales bacterium]